MFESLSTRLQDVFKTLRGETRLTPETVEAALREIRLALLEADVNFKVVKAFVDRVRDRAMGQDVLRSLSPSQQVVKIVRDEMLALFGDSRGRPASRRPSGRASSCCSGCRAPARRRRPASWRKWLTKQGTHPLLVSTDVKRPAAIQQLNVVGQKAGGAGARPGGTDGSGRAREGRAGRGRRTSGFDVVIVDTAGRLHIDDELMTELVAIKDATEPSDLLYVADAMTGQDAIKSAGEFNRRVGVTGVVLTKLDGDARGGAALSVVSVVGVPIAFVGSGERLEDLEPFHPDRVVSRVLGMGDVLSLIERAEAGDRPRRSRAARGEAPGERVHARGFPRSAEDDPEDGAARADPRDAARDGQHQGAGGATSRTRSRSARVEAIISSMTPDERRKQHIINGSRRKRIARGSGTSVEEVNRLLKQFVQMQKMLKSLGGMAGSGGRRRQGCPAPGDADAAEQRLERSERRRRYWLRRRRHAVCGLGTQARSEPAATGTEPRGHTVRRVRWSSFVCGGPDPRSARSSASSSPTRARRATAASSRSSGTTTRAPSRRS